MKQKPLMQRIGDFMEGKGFYIVLFLCVTAIGISGYYLFSGLLSTKPLSLDEPLQQVAGNSSQVEMPSQTPSVAKPPELSGPTTKVSTENVTPSQATVFTWPLHGTVSRDFSLEVFAYDATMGDWRTHSGLDIEANLGTEVMAVSSGTVSDVTKDALMGMTVVIDHDNGLQSVYCNLNELPTVSVGDQVTTGVVIGAVGNTAIAESAAAPHLHFEMHKDGIAVDPVQYLPDGN